MSSRPSNSEGLTTKSKPGYCRGAPSRLLLTGAMALLLSSKMALASLCDGVGCIVWPQSDGLYGKSYAEWSAAYWQWLFSLPRDQNPELDGNGCQNAANGQWGPVWFLAQSGGSTAVRNCTAVAKALFFPIIAGESSTLEPPPFYGGNEAELRASIGAILDQATAVSCELDGVSLTNLSDYRVQSPLYQIALPASNLADVPGGGTGLSVADGYYVMITALNSGPHTIHTHGEVPTLGFVQDITYNLTIERPPELIIGSVLGKPTLQIAGEFGRTYVVEYSSALSAGKTWAALPAFALTNNPQTVVDLTATNSSQRFYRARRMP